MEKVAGLILLEQSEKASFANVQPFFHFSPAHRSLDVALWQNFDLLNGEGLVHCSMIAPFE